jgi:prepilin-type N-terminal cleavage/methylation domain-containing protein
MHSQRAPLCSPDRRARAQAGFSFVELMLVMGIMAVLMGLAIGFLTSAGKSGKMAQARRLIQETAYRCINASMGSRSAFFTLREGVGEEEGALVIEAGVSRTILTHQMEDLQFASGARSPSIEGQVVLKKHEGITGSGAYFRGGALVFGAEPIFAATDGLEIEAWVRPEPRGRDLTVLRGQAPGGEMVYELVLARDGEAPYYQVRFTLMLRETDALSADLPALPLTVQTQKSAILGDGKTWNHVQARFDGEEVEIRVGGQIMDLQNRARRVPGATPPPKKRRRIAVPASGVVQLSISAQSRGFQGMMDAVIVRGVFQSSDNRHVLPDELMVHAPPLPLRVSYENGRLVGTGASDQVIWMGDRAHPTDLPLKFTFGRGGTVEYQYTNEPIPGTTRPVGRTAPKGPQGARGGSDATEGSDG